MLQITDLVLDAWGRRFFDKATVKLPKDAHVGLVGRNGVGKSTLFKVVLGELQPGGGAKMARSAGSSVQLVAKEGGFATLRLPSTEMRRVSIDCRATVGEVGNAEQSNINWGKAGRMRWKGVRPTVRGVAMNPVDHPHGGGEGKTSGGRHPVSPWGQKEGRTRHINKESDKLIVRRRNAGKKRK